MNEMMPVNHNFQIQELRNYVIKVPLRAMVSYMEIHISVIPSEGGNTLLTNQVSKEMSTCQLSSVNSKYLNYKHYVISAFKNKIS